MRPSGEVQTHYLTLPSKVDRLPRLVCEEHSLFRKSCHQLAALDAKSVVIARTMIAFDRRSRSGPRSTLFFRCQSATPKPLPLKT